MLVVAGAGAGALDPLGVALALAAACVYSAYILISEGVSERVRPQLLSALVCSGAAVTLTIGSAALGELRPGDLTLAGWGWMACIALISTVARGQPLLRRSAPRRAPRAPRSSRRSSRS